MESAENKVIIKLVRQAQNQGSSTWTVIAAEGGLKSTRHTVCKRGYNASGTLCSALVSSHLGLPLPLLSCQLSTKHALTDSETQEGRLVSFCLSFLHEHTG